VAVDLAEGAVIDVRRGGGAVTLLLVADVVLDTGLDTLVLKAPDGVLRTVTAEPRVTAKALPVAAASSHTTHVGHGSESNVDTLSAELLTHGLATSIHEPLVEAVIVSSES